MLADYEIAIQDFVSKILFQFVPDQSGGRNSQLGVEWGEEEGREGGESEEGEDGLWGWRFRYLFFFKDSFVFLFVDSLFVSLLPLFYRELTSQRKSLLITLPIPPKFYEEMKEIEGKRVAIVPCFFSQGINEQQSLAIRYLNLIFSFLFFSFFKTFLPSPSH